MMAQNNLPNGVLPQMTNPPTRPEMPSLLNGVNSQHSSRDPSPSQRLLPRSGIPASQLPPSRSPLTVTGQKMERMSLGSPYSTSTPNQTLQGLPPSAFSPISPANKAEVQVPTVSTRSAQPQRQSGQFESVNIKGPQQKETNPLETVNLQGPPSQPFGVKPPPHLNSHGFQSEPTQSVFTNLSARKPDEKRPAQFPFLPSGQPQIPISQPFSVSEAVKQEQKPPPPVSNAGELSVNKLGTEKPHQFDFRPISSKNVNGGQKTEVDAILSGIKMPPAIGKPGLPTNPASLQQIPLSNQQTPPLGQPSNQQISQTINQQISNRPPPSNHPINTKPQIPPFGQPISSNANHQLPPASLQSSQQMPRSNSQQMFNNPSAFGPSTNQQMPGSQSLGPNQKPLSTNQQLPSGVPLLSQQIPTSQPFNSLPVPRNQSTSNQQMPMSVNQKPPQGQPFQQQMLRNSPSLIPSAGQQIPVSLNQQLPNNQPNVWTPPGPTKPPLIASQIAPPRPAANTAPIPPTNQAWQQQQQQQQPRTGVHANRYPQQQLPTLPPSNAFQQQAPAAPVANFYPQHPQQPQMPPPGVYQQQPAPFQQPKSVVQTGFNRLWGQEHIDLLQNPNVLPSDKIQTPRVYLGNDSLDSANCSSEVFRCTMLKIPESNSLLQKSRLPLGVLIHPFKDLNHLPVIQCNVIVRCRTCRTYINPFVFFVDSKRWKCNLCYRVNELPDEFQFDPVSKTYGDPARRPEIKASTIEYIAPAEYMLRPPQPAVYLFLLDVSRLAVESGYLQSACAVLLEELKNLPGDARAQVGIITYDSSVHFFYLAEGMSQPHEMTVLDIDEIFLPCPENLLANLKDRVDLITDLLTQIPTRYNNSFDNNSSLGAALQAAHKLLSPTGGRVTVFQSCLPNVGPGALQPREDINQRNGTEVTNLNPANDFYKRLALECSSQQIAVDLFVLNSQYVDIATISGISKFSGGTVHHFPLFKASRILQNERFERSFRRYLTRKIGFEAVMRVRCTRGLSIHTFHGNFFVRSTDLLSLPNVNPDSGFGMQISIDENLTDVQSVCFQAALLYTSSKGERRIRVHTLCLPVCSTLSDVINSADQQSIVALLAKMAVDRSLQSSLNDAREAFINVAIDILSSYKLSLNMGENNSLLAPQNLKLLPLYISALLKFIAFRTNPATRLDDRVKAMIDMKTKPIGHLIQMIYPDLYAVHNLEEQPVVLNQEEEQVPHPPHLQLSARCLDSKGAFLLDTGEHMILVVCPGAPQKFLGDVLGVPNYGAISDEMYELPVLDNPHNQRLHQFINYLNDEKPIVATLHIIRDNSPFRGEFFERLIEDRMENALSYHEFIQHVKSQMK